MTALDQEVREALIEIKRMYQAVDSIFAELDSFSGEGSVKTASERSLAIEAMKEQVFRKTSLIIAKFQPLGKDLVLCEMMIGVSYDLYRIARYLREIAILMQSVGSLGEEIEAKAINSLKIARIMVREAVRAFLSGDLKLVEKVYKDDDLIDRIYTEYLKQLTLKETITSQKAASILFARHVERIADHATYIAKATEKVGEGRQIAISLD